MKDDAWDFLFIHSVDFILLPKASISCIDACICIWMSSFPGLFSFIYEFFFPTSKILRVFFFFFLSYCRSRQILDEFRFRSYVVSVFSWITLKFIDQEKSRENWTLTYRFGLLCFRRLLLLLLGIGGGVCWSCGESFDSISETSSSFFTKIRRCIDWLNLKKEKNDRIQS